MFTNWNYKNRDINHHYDIFYIKYSLNWPYCLFDLQVLLLINWILCSFNQSQSNQKVIPSQAKKNVLIANKHKLLGSRVVHFLMESGQVGRQSQSWHWSLWRWQFNKWWQIQNSRVWWRKIKYIFICGCVLQNFKLQN